MLYVSMYFNETFLGIDIWHANYAEKVRTKQMTVFPEKVYQLILQEILCNKSLR